jgi:hypothetical protein
MLYDPLRDLYALVGVDPDASLDEVGQAIGDRRGEPGVEEVAWVLLDAARRTRYDARRARHRVNQMIAFDRVRNGAPVSR